VWWTGANGSLESDHTYDLGQTWSHIQIAPPSSVSLTGGIAAVSRIPNSMEVWWIQPDGAVEGSYFYDGGTWTRYRLAGPGTASPTSGLTAASRIPQTMDVFWINSKGRVSAGRWREETPPRFWAVEEVAPAGSASPTSSIAALSRLPTTVEVWWAKTDGSLQDAYWFENAAWQRYPVADPGTTPQGGGITAATRFPPHMEVFTSGRVLLPSSTLTITSDHYWFAGMGWNHRDFVKQTSLNVTAGSREDLDFVRAICSAPTAGCALTESSTLLLMLQPTP
jgi:hypothetical protein